jgi:DNA polymerase-3 subunit delta
LKSQPQTAGFRQIEQDLRNDVFRTAGIRVVLLYGSEGLLADVYARRLAATFLMPGAEPMDGATFDAEELRADTLIGACDTLPMLSERRVVTVKNIRGDEKSLAGADMKRLAEYLPEVPASTLLILSADSVSKRSALYKNALKDGKTYAFDRLERSDLKAFVKNRFAQAGKHADAESVDALIAASGYLQRDADTDLYAVEGDIARVAAYADREEIRPSDISACMGVPLETDVFRMLDAVSSGDKGTAIELLIQLLERGESAFRLLPLLTSQFEMMLGYKEMRERGKSFGEIMRALDIKSEFRLKKAASYAERYSLSGLMHLTERLYRVEPDIRTGLFPEQLALTMFLAEM